MTGLVRRTFGINLSVLRILGFYPPRKFAKLYRVYSYAVYYLFIVALPVLTVLYLAQNFSFAQLADTLFIICQIGGTVVKVLPFVMKSEQIRESLYMIQDPLFTMYTKNQETIVDECVRICRRNCRFFLIFCAFTVSGWALGPLLAGGYQLPIPIWLPFNFTERPKLYYPTFLYVSAGGINGAFANGVIDPLIAGFACFATSQLKILKDNLQHLSEYSEAEIFSDSENEELRAKIIYDKIRVCIAHHNAILNFVKNYERVYSSVAFAQLAASVVIICICCLQLSIVEPFTLPFFWLLIFLSNMLLEIFLYCYYGTMLFEENNTLTNAVYMGKWYEYDVKSRRALLILMECSKRPMIVTVGKLLDLSLETFTMVLRRAYSLLAVLKNY